MTPKWTRWHDWRPFDTGLGMPVGDPGLRRVVAALLNHSNDTGRLKLELDFANRVNDLARQASPYFYADDWGVDPMLLWRELNPIFQQLGIAAKDYSDLPIIDSVSERDFQSILQSIEDDGMSGVKVEYPTPLLKFTAYVDLLNLGETEGKGGRLRLIENRPRTFSADALKDMQIPSDPKRHPDDATENALRIDWIENDSTQVVIESSAHKDRGTTTAKLNKDSKFVVLTNQDLHSQTWSVKTEAIKTETDKEEGA